MLRRPIPLALLLVALPLSTAHGLRQEEPRTVLRNVTVIDVDEGRALPDRTVVVHGDRIERVLEGAPADLSADARAIDASGLFLYPGLIDAHVHYSAGMESFGPLCVANGVTFVRDMGGATAMILEVRDALNRGDRSGPEMVATGAIVDGRPPVWPFSEAVDDVDEARAAVRKLAAAGVDQIKLYSRLKREVYLAALAEAHAQGLKAVGHVPESVTISDAVAAGQDEIAHLTGFDHLIGRLVPAAELPERGGEWASFAYWFELPNVDPAALEPHYRAIAEAGTVVCPTLVVMAGIAQVPHPELRDEELLAYVPQHLRSFWDGGQYDQFGRSAKRALPHMQTVVAGLHEAGVTLLVGSDLANPYVIAGFAVHEEMRLMQEAGIPTADVLRSATAVPAEFLGVGERLGRIRAGYTASMVLSSKNPLEDVGNAAAIEGVFLRGRYFDREALDELLAGVRAEVGASPELATVDASAEVVTPSAVSTEEPDLGDEVIARGKLNLVFAGQFPAGTEEFVIAREGTGYRTWVKSTPAGASPQRPFVLDFHYDAELGLERGVYRQLIEPPLEATYSVADGRLVAEARQGTKSFEPTTQPFPDDAAVSAPTFSGPFFLLERLALEVGQKRTVTSYVFGQPSWELLGGPVEVERNEDAILEGREGPLRSYRMRAATPTGEIVTDVWLDARGVVVRYVMKLPFGTLSAELE